MTRQEPQEAGWRQGRGCGTSGGLPAEGGPLTARRKGEERGRRAPVPTDSFPLGRVQCGGPLPQLSWASPCPFPQGVPPAGFASALCGCREGPAFSGLRLACPGPALTAPWKPHPSLPARWGAPASSPLVLQLPPRPSVRNRHISALEAMPVFPVGFTNNFKFYCFLSLMNPPKPGAGSALMSVQPRPAARPGRPPPRRRAQPRLVRRAGIHSIDGVHRCGSRAGALLTRSPR